MKQHFWILLLLLPLALVSCEKDPCEGVECQNDGVCFDGDCQCQPGFRGVDCSEDDCDNRNCQNGGVCVLGVCDCPMEFTGIECEKRVTDEFVGIFITDLNAANNCLSQEHAVVISNGQDAREVILYNIQDDSLFTMGYLENPNHISFQEDGVISGSLIPNSVNSINVQYISNTGPDCTFLMRRLQ